MRIHPVRRQGRRLNFKNQGAKLALLALMGLQSSVSFAGGFTGATLGVSVPSAMGDPYQALGNGIGGQIEALIDVGLFTNTQLHIVGNYQRFTIQNTANIASVNMAGLLAGLQLQSDSYGNSITPFTSLDVGAMADFTTFNASVAQMNSGIAFTAQMVPGIDIPLWKNFGLDLETPIRAVFVRTPTLFLDAVVAVRIKL
jgi:hypothetical protein